MTIQTEKEAKVRREYTVELNEKIVQRSIKAGSVQSLFRRENMQYVYHIEMFMIFEIRGFLNLYGALIIIILSVTIIIMMKMRIF